MDPTGTPISPRQIKVPLPLLEKVEARADKEGLNYRTLIAHWLTEWATYKMATPRLRIDFSGESVPLAEPEARHYDQQRKIKTRQVSFRIPDHIWEAAMRRAKKEGTALSPVGNRILRGYAEYKIN